MQTISLKINGKEVQARADQTILDVVQQYKLDEIPTMCHSPELEPYGSCFLCLVEVKGKRNLVPSCATRVASNMEVTTRSDRILQARRAALELLLSNHYADCLSPCNLGCPAHVDAQGYIALTAMGLYHEAVDLIRKTNPFPSICGRVCVRKCEVVCRRKEIDEPVAINHIKRYITDMPGIYDKVPPRNPATGKKVAIVGAGPSGLTAAYYLGLWGHEVSVYEALPKPGGMLRYGIPQYRLPKEVLDREIEYILRASGAKLELNKRIGYHISLEHLQQQFDALYIAAGASGSNKMRVKGEDDTPEVRLGVDFLREKTDDPSPVQGTVVVIGGGNTAMDAARVSWRLGAEKVIILYRRTKAEMPADPMEIQACLDEKIEIIELAAPVGIVKNKDGHLQALRCTRMVLGEPDSSGRRRPIPQEGSEFDLPCDLAISAIGQQPILKGLTQGKEEITQTRWGTIVVDPETMATNVPGIFAGGDVADDGPTVVIDAIADGGKAARSIHKYLGNEISQPLIAVTKEQFGKPTRNELGNIPESPRHELHELEVEERAGNFREVATGYEDEDAVHECARCLSCGCFAASDCLLRKYSSEYGVDMKRFTGYIRKQRVDDRHPYIIYDPNKCILCARCIRTCSKVLSVSALGYVNRGFKTEVRPAMNDPLVMTNCVSCGNCIDSCPTGALTMKLFFPGRCDLERKKIPTHCGFCSLLCPITVNKYSENRYFIESSGVPGEYICRFGRFGYELFTRGRRITTPLIKKNGRLEESGWEETYHYIVERLKNIASQYGPESIAVLASPELSNEELFLIGRIAREGLGTGNTGSLSVLISGADLHALDNSFGFTGSTTDMVSLKECDLIVCNNVDLERDNLILSIAVIAAMQQNKAHLIHCSSAESSLSKMAQIHLDPIRGRSSLLWNAVIQYLLDDGFFDRNVVKTLPGGQEFIADQFDYRPQTLEKKTGVEVEKIKRAAEMIRNAHRIVFIHSLDRTNDRSPGDIITLANFMLLLKTRNIQSNLLLPTSYANFMGTAWMGVEPGYSAGRIATNIPGARNYEALRTLLTDSKLKGALLIGEDPMREGSVSSYFRNLEFLGVMDSGWTASIDFADVVLPGTTYLESSGTRCDFMGTVHEYRPVLSPPSGKMGWQVLSELARSFSIEDIPDSIPALQQTIEKVLKENISHLLPYFWNRGERKSWNGEGKLLVAPTEELPARSVPTLTWMSTYKYGAKTIDISHFKVRS